MTLTGLPYPSEQLHGRRGSGRVVAVAVEARGEDRMDALEPMKGERALACADESISCVAARGDIWAGAGSAAGVQGVGYYRDDLGGEGL